MFSNTNTFSFNVSIIIVNYNTLTLLNKCLQTIYEKTTHLSYEVIVVDNASEEDPKEILQSTFPEVVFINSTTNLGFGKANNLGAMHAQGEYLFFLNSDTILINNAVGILYHFLKAHPKAGICGANLYDSQNNPNFSYFQFPSLQEEFKIFLPSKVNIKKHHNYSGHPKVVDCISGADLMISKTIFNQVGSFDPDFFLYYEESELTWRVRKTGYLAYSVPEAKIIHYHGMSVSKEAKALNKTYIYSKFLYFRKTHHKYAPIAIKQIQLIKCICALCLYFLCRRKEKISYWTTKYKTIHQLYADYQKLFMLKKKGHKELILL